jgi:hypothetical protein
VPKTPVGGPIVFLLVSPDDPGGWPKILKYNQGGTRRVYTCTDKKKEAARWSVTTLEHSAVLVHHRYRDDRRRRPAGHFHVRQGGTQKKRTTSSNEGGNVYSQKWADYICAEDNQVFKREKEKNLCDLSPPNVLAVCQRVWNSRRSWTPVHSSCLYISTTITTDPLLLRVVSCVHGNNVVR